MLVVSGDPAQIVQAAVSLIPDNYSPKPELLECFYRETVRKRQRFTYISEAVARIYKSPYDRGSVYRDRAALEKSRILLSQRRSDTLSIKMMGGPTQAITQDVVKNSDILFDPDELNLYHFEMAAPVHMDGRTQFVIRLTPKTECDYALYHGTLYIDRETLAFSRIELSLDMSDKGKATRMMLVRKPLTLRFTPRELSLIINYRWDAHSVSTVTGRGGCSPPLIRLSTNWLSRMLDRRRHPLPGRKCSVPPISWTRKPANSWILISGRITTSSNLPKAWNMRSNGSRKEDDHARHSDRTASFRPVFTYKRHRFTAGQFPAPAEALVHGLLLSELVE